MSDQHLFNLEPGWALGYDERQWMVLRRRNSRTQSGWKPVAFVCFDKGRIAPCPT